MLRTLISRSLGAMAAVGLGLAVTAIPVTAANSFSLFGDATIVQPGNNSSTAVQLRSSTSVGAGFAGIDFHVPSGLTFGQINALGTDYNFTAASCGLGAPRFSISIGSANVFVYIGPPPNYTGCASNTWVSTGNLVAPASFVDTSQLPGGTFYDTFAAADAKYGSDAVKSIQLVADAGFAFSGGTQTVVIDNVVINDTTYTFESEESCKDGGWQAFTTSPGPFKNQGDCVSHFVSGG
jgi:hypothetical protein